MVEIKARYIDIFGKSLAKTVKDECGGKYEKFLLELIGES